MDIVLGNHPGQTRTFEKMERLGEEKNPFIDPGAWDRIVDLCEGRYERLQKNDPID